MVMDSFTFTVGKLDAGMAILIGERAHLIEFPSLLLPPGVSSGSIVNIAVHRNVAEEKRQKREFWELQDRIFETFGQESPSPPELQVRNVTQTSVTLEWPPIHLATANLRSLDIYRNGERLAVIPNPLQNTSTKLSGLEMNTQYTFQLILRTTAGTHPSNIIKLTTHTMTDTSGISVCFGTVDDPVLLENAKLALNEMKARWSDRVQIDTTHFVCTTPASTPMGASVTGGVVQQPGVEYQKALQASIPIVMPHWVLACHQGKKMAPISQFQLGTAPPAGLNLTPFTRSVSSNKAKSPPTTEESGESSKSGSSAFVNQPGANQSVDKVPHIITDAKQQPKPSASATSLHDGAEEAVTPTTPSGEHSARTGKPARRRQGTMQRDFKFPSPSPSPANLPPIPPAAELSKQVDDSEAASEHDTKPHDDGTPTAPAEEPKKTPAPPPLPELPPEPTRKQSQSGISSIGDDELGETEEVDLS
ncbi:Chitin synthase, class 5 [Tulasnella sp. 427]|nr:Chitin synthase, class 5 [Tulasnella sp. 427]